METTMRSVGIMLLVLASTAAHDATAQSTFERSSDRRTVNDRMFRLPRPAPRLCQDMCFRDEACRSWTYVEFGEPVASCWLGDIEQDPRPDQCCVAGVVR
jgi:hypothetical protein